MKRLFVSLHSAKPCNSSRTALATCKGSQHMLEDIWNLIGLVLQSWKGVASDWDRLSSSSVLSDMAAGLETFRTGAASKGLRNEWPAIGQKRKRCVIGEHHRVSFSMQHDTQPHRILRRWTIAHCFLHPTSAAHSCEGFAFQKLQGLQSKTAQRQRPNDLLQTSVQSHPSVGRERLWLFWYPGKTSCFNFLTYAPASNKMLHRQ